MKTVYYILYLVANSLGFLIIGEITLRVKCTYCDDSELNGGEYLSPFDEDSKWRNWYGSYPPGINMKYNLPQLDYSLRTNHLGIRDIEHPIEKAKNEIRIVMLGDSFTEGVGAPFDSSMPQLTGQYLNSVLQDSFHVRVISGGIQGSDPISSIKLFEDYLISYDPDYVVLSLTCTDITDIMVRGGRKRFLPDGTLNFNAPPKRLWLYQRLHMYRFLLLTVLSYDDYTLLSPSELRSRGQTAIDLIKEDILKLKEKSDHGKFHLLVVFVPMLPELEFYYEDGMDQLIEFVHGQGINYLDIKDYFIDTLKLDCTPMEAIYWPMNNHFTPAGYAYYSEGIFKELYSEIVVRETWHQ